jgi:8-oxo-dGTP diphosphatase
MVAANGAVVATGERLEGTKHRPPQLYRYDASVELADQGPLAAQNPATQTGEKK